MVVHPDFEPSRFHWDVADYAPVSIDDEDVSHWMPAQALRRLARSKRHKTRGAVRVAPVTE